MSSDEAKANDFNGPLVESAFRDLTTRFFLNLPPSELQSFDRIFYQLGQAHWYYEDFLRENDKSLPNFSLKEFCYEFFQACPLLSPHLPKFDDLFKQFQEYLYSVPVSGAILLNEAMDKVLLVRGWNGKSWGFPKGKLNEGENEVQCAVREVMEETNVDISAKLSKSDFVEGHGKEIKLFIVHGIDEDQEFKAHLRKEISEIRWFTLNELNVTKSTPSKLKFRLWNVRPFLPGLRKWIKKKKLANVADYGSSSDTAGNASSSHISRSKSSARKQKNKKVQKVTACAVEETFGADAKGWSVEEMFSANQLLFGIQPTAFANPDEITSSLALYGSNYKSYSRSSSAHAAGHGASSSPEAQSPVKSAGTNSTNPWLISMNAASWNHQSAYEDRDAEVFSEFQFDVAGVMNALVSHMKV